MSGERSSKWFDGNYGTCPKCGEYRFIGHGPLCLDCFITPRSTNPDDEQESSR